MSKVGPLFAACEIGVMVAITLLTLLFASARVAHANTLPQDAPAAQNNQPVVIYFFWGDGCPHCAEAKPFLQELVDRYPSVELRAYEVWYSQPNQELFFRMAAARGFEASGVPTIFIGDRYWVGYAEQLAEQIAAKVDECTRSGCADAGIGIIPGVTAPTPTSVPDPAAPLPPEAVAASVAARADSVDQAAGSQATSAQATSDVLKIPLIGTVDLGAQSLAVSTALIAFVDGFNPCSLWVLSILLALTLHMGSRRKVFWVGMVFLTVTSLFYALFITGLFTIFSVVGFLGWIQAIVAVVALFFAIVNIKDYFWYKEGLSFTIADEKKPGIYRQMRNVVQAGQSTWGLIGATVVLGAGVSLVEFSCTAGFPILWTNLLTTQQANASTFGWLLLLYMFIYQLDELVIFLVAVFTLKASKFEEKQGRMLKLVGGMLMLTLAAVMLINPAWMGQVSTSLLVFVVAFAATAVVLVAHRFIMPRLGLYVGTELRPHNLAPDTASPAGGKSNTARKNTRRHAANLHSTQKQGHIRKQ